MSDTPRQGPDSDAAPGDPETGQGAQPSAESGPRVEPDALLDAVDEFGSASLELLAWEFSVSESSIEPDWDLFIREKLIIRTEIDPASGETLYRLTERGVARLQAHLRREPARRKVAPMPTTHTYGAHAHQFGQLHLPAGTACPPVAVLVHGGFWMTENGGLERMNELCGSLTAHGWAAWNVEYRRLGGGGDGGWPQSAHDVSAAVDHLARLGDALDLARVVTIGHSAGGHLTLIDAARGERAFTLAGTVAQAPVTDMLAAHALSGPGIAIIEAFMAGTPVDRAAAYAEASPVRLLPVGVPQLIVQGERDDRVPAGLVADYVATAQAAGDRVSFELRGGDGHFEHLDPESGAWAAALAWITQAAGPGPG